VDYFVKNKKIFICFVLLEYFYIENVFYVAKKLQNEKYNVCTLFLLIIL
jgi:hypothetical protein